MIIINIFTMIIVAIAIYITGIAAAKVNKNVILGTTLPHEKLESEEVKEIVNRYKKANLIYSLVVLVLYSPCFLLENKMSLWLYYVLLWCVIVIYGQTVVYKKYFNELQTLKKNNDWYLVKNNIIRIDTEAIGNKNKMIISPLWFISTAIVYLIAVIIKSDIIYILAMMFTSVICIIMYYVYAKKRIVVYTKDTDKNMVCNYISRRIYSELWVIISFVTSLNTIFYKCSENVFLLLTIISLIIILVAIIYCTNKVREKQNAILESANEEIITDNDIYYGAMFYNDPNDSSVMVESRNGVGLTINIGNKKGKAIMILITVFIIAMLAPCIYLMSRLDNATFTMSVTGNHIEIDAPIYNTSFSSEDIEEVSIVKYSDLKDVRRTNGASMEYVNLGNFTIKGYGKVKVYIYKYVDDIVAIKLKDKYVFINGKTEEDTNKYYNMIKNLI